MNGVITYFKLCLKMYKKTYGRGGCVGYMQSANYTALSELPSAICPLLRPLFGRRLLLKSHVSRAFVFLLFRCYSSTVRHILPPAFVLKCLPDKDGASLDMFSFEGTFTEDSADRG